MKRLKALFQKYREIILYLVFGGLTTLVNFVVYFLCTSGLSLSWSVSNVAAWVLAVLFAYVTNRIWVFQSKTKGASALLREFLSFVLCRLLSLGFDMAIMFLCIDLLHWDTFKAAGLPMGEFGAKLLAQIVVIIANYIFSKLIIFRHKSAG